MSSFQGSSDEWLPPFCVALHDSRRDGPVTETQLNDAINCNCNMLTSFVTNSHFRRSIHVLVSEFSSGHAVPTVPGLTDLDTHLEPGTVTSSLVAFTSPWIDVCSPDPLVAGISKQVLLMEVAFAAFCGLDHVVIQGPNLHHHDSLRREDVATNNIIPYARAIQESLNVGLRIQISILLPFCSDSRVSEQSSEHLRTRDDFIEPDLDPKLCTADLLDTWEAWNTIRTTCKYHTRLTVVLQMPLNLSGSHVQSRWFSEPVKAMIFDKPSFTVSSKGYPIFQPAVRAFFKDVMRLRIAPWIILADVGTIPIANATGGTPYADGDIPEEMVATGTDRVSTDTLDQDSDMDDLPYLNYIRYLETRQEPRSRMERDTAGYQDYLQIPLQPLADNLESITYEVFERDPVKYDLYEEALRKALRNFFDNRKSTSGPVGQVTVVVAGAGRGPLITRALRASQIENVAIDLWAIEKNPNALVLLQRHNRTKWNGRVNIEPSDMRSWKGPWKNSYSPTPAEAFAVADPSEVVISKAYYPIDILVSELLGSLGDNELSPECLDGISHLIATPDGISIPRSYTAWLTPISAPRLHADISQREQYDATAPETPAVVWLNQIDYLSRESGSKTVHQQPPADSTANGNPRSPSSKGQKSHTSNYPKPHVLCAWEFKHQQSDPDSTKSMSSGQALASTGNNAHNSRFTKLSFRIRHRGICHGIGGYFEAVLYPGVELSTNPNTIGQKSKDMISWFPIFFPLKTPLYIPSISTIDVSMWRQTDGRKVWYEWMLESWGWNIASGSSNQPADASNAGNNASNSTSISDTAINPTDRDRRMIKLGTTELHSSIKNACLM